MMPKFQPDIPADIPSSAHKDYIINYATITRNTGKLFLFACDQKIEHLNADFYGEHIAPDALDPEHIFRIGAQAPIGALATHPGLIARYGKKYPTINYIAKLNGSTNLVSPQQRDPVNRLLWQVSDIVTMKKNSKLPIRGVGYTIYLGSEFEGLMLEQAAQVVYQAHQHGLVTILWIYPRGKSVTNENDPALMAGAAGVAASLGSDFVKVKPAGSHEDLARAATAAGNTKIICSGGKAVAPETFLQALHMQLHKGKMAGTATGRNLFQKSLPEAIAFAKAIAAIMFENKDAATAYDEYQKNSPR